MKKLVGVFATIALLGSGAALADDDKNKPPQQDPSSAQGGSGAAGSESLPQDSSMQQDPATQDPAMGGSGATQDDPAMGGSGSTQSDPAMGGSGAAMGQKELTGKVVKAESKMVWVDMQGTVVPLKVDKTTTFGDANIKRAKDLQVGQEIRASYEVKETDNVAKSISMSGTGGSGSGDVMSPDSSINEGTGGTGLEEDKGMQSPEAPPSSDPGMGGSGSSGSDTMNPDTSSGSDTR
ncbi:RNA-binding protein [Pyxidicoccus sp. 3LFB2]